MVILVSRFVWQLKWQAKRDTPLQIKLAELFLPRQHLPKALP